jgi:bifunctional oligoribonuclease and PAP phosphatase NrnA
MTTKAPEDVVRKIRQGNRFLLTSHANPDGDAIGSEVGLARILRGMGKGAVIWNRDPTPSLYQPLPGTGRIHSGEEPPTGFPEMFDGVIVLECPSLDRSGLDETLAQLPVTNIDHHLGNQHYGVVNWVDPAAPAVGEMVHRLAQGLKVAVDADTATALYLTLVTDTGGFRFSNANPAAFEAAAALVREGARPEQVSEWLYESYPLPMMRLAGEMLRSLEVHADGRVATALVTHEMLERAGATTGDTEGLTDYPRSIAGVQAAAVVRQLDGGRYKVSLRSRGEVDVEKVARHRGGGGHKNAAGFEQEGAGDEVVAAVVADLAELLDEG